MSHSFWNLAFLSLVTTSSVSCFPWGDELPLFISKTVSARSPSLKCHILSVTLSSSNGSLCSREWASVCFPFGPTCTQGSRCHESIIMLLHQECSSVKWFFFFFFLVKNTVATWTPSASILIPIKAPAVLPLLLLHRQCKCQLRGKANNIFILLWK